MRLVLFSLILLSPCLSFKWCASAAGTRSLQLGILPYEAADKVRENFRPFAEYLSRSTGQDVHVYVGTDYVAIIEALRADKVDVVLLTPFPYVLASSQVKLVPLFSWLQIKEKGKRGTPYYSGVIIARKDSGIRKIEDLKGKRMAFMDPASTSGHLYPAELMMRHGINPRTDLKMEYYAGNADALVNAVFNKHIDAGALYKGGMERVLKDPDRIQQLRVIAETRDIPNGVLAVRANLPRHTISAIRKAVADLDRSGDCERICEPFAVNGWVPASNTMFNSVRKAAKVLRLDLKTK